MPDKLMLIFHRIFFGNAKAITMYGNRTSFLDRIPKGVVSEIFKKPGYGNHRKFCAKKYDYYARAHGNFRERLRFLVNSIDMGRSFDTLYRKLLEVESFGRLAAWDSLQILDTMVLEGKLSPKRMYLSGSTGPKKGVFHFYGVTATEGLKRKVNCGIEEAGMRILDTIRRSRRVPDEIRRDKFLIYRLEDALCNFQKDKFKGRG